jgi:uncharacterized protein (TIGR03083 family)
MVTQMAPQEYVAAVRREGGALAHAARQDPARPVPYYPGWSVADLVAHTGSVHRWALEIVRSRATEGGPREEYEGRDPIRLLAWFEEGLEELSRELEKADSSEPVWSFADQTVGFWQRRMAHETAIHRWDAQSAFGDAQPIECRLAATGIPESLAIHVVQPTRNTAIGGHGESVALLCDDVSDGWIVVLLPDEVCFEEGTGPATSRAAGTASDVWLFVTGRPAPRIRLGGETTAATKLQRIVRSVGAPKSPKRLR